MVGPKPDRADLPRVCVITGGSSGIGLATALRFVAAGDHVAICGRDEARLSTAKRALESEAADASQVLVRRLDVSQPGSVQKFIDDVRTEMGRVDVLFSNAGYPPCDAVCNITREQFDQAIAVNIAATFEGTQAAWPIMQEQGQGVIINMSSMAAIDPFEGFSVYGACKAWIELFSRATASEGQPIGIRVVCIRPGAVDTPMLRALFADFPAEELVLPTEVATVIFQACDCGKPATTEPITISRS